MKRNKISDDIYIDMDYIEQSDEIHLWRKYNLQSFSFTKKEFEELIAFMKINYENWFHNEC